MIPTSGLLSTAVAAAVVVLGRSRICEQYLNHT